MKVLADVTEFFNSPIRTGIQRVVAQLCSRWAGEVPLQPVIFSPQHGMVEVSVEAVALMKRYFEASASEEDSLRAAIQAKAEEARRSGKPVQIGPTQRLLVPELFFDSQRVSFYSALGPESLTYVYFIVYDIIPLTRPEFFAPNLPHATIGGYFRLVRGAPRVGFISRATARDYYQRLRRSPMGDGPVFWLGADGLGPRDAGTAVLHGTFTMLGTIEPRKNHKLVLRALKPLLARVHSMRLRYVGMVREVDEDFIREIRELSAPGGPFELIETADDQATRRLIAESSATLFVSSAEGYGLPPLESLWLGVPVVAAPGIPSLEPFENRGVLVLQSTTEEMIRIAALSMLNPEFREQKAAEARALHLPTWHEFVESVQAWVLDGALRPHRSAPAVARKLATKFKGGYAGRKAE